MTDTTTTVLDIPAGHQISRSQKFPTLDDAIAFAKRNDARLFYLRDGVWAFQNYGKRTAEQIAA